MMRAKQKIVQGRGRSNLNLDIFVCSFDACRASKPVPSINYVVLEGEFGFFQTTFFINRDCGMSV